MDGALTSLRNDGVSLAGVDRTFKVEGRDVLALSNVSLECEPGSFTALIGPSGCGKSTLLRIIAGLDHPDRGAVSIGGAAPIEKCRQGALGLPSRTQRCCPGVRFATTSRCRSKCLAGPYRTKRRASNS
jgi:ABC-type glutathione transport system ATPase component